MNIGYLEAVKLFNMDCVLFHDVDTLIERDDNMVICGDKPVHFAAYADRHEYRYGVLLAIVDLEGVEVGVGALHYTTLHSPGVLL